MLCPGSSSGTGSAVVPASRSTRTRAPATGSRPSLVTTMRSATTRMARCSRAAHQRATSPAVASQTSGRSSCRRTNARCAPRRASSRVAEDAAVDDADVEAAGLVHEGDLGAHRAAQLADVVALEQRLDAVGRAHRQLEAAARAQAAVLGEHRGPVRQVEPHAAAEVIEALAVDVGVRRVVLEAEAVEGPDQIGASGRAAGCGSR